LIARVKASLQQRKRELVHQLLLNHAAILAAQILAA
jgi:hypothetical protein